MIQYFEVTYQNYNPQTSPHDPTPNKTTSYPTIQQFALKSHSTSTKLQFNDPSTHLKNHN